MRAFYETTRDSMETPFTHLKENDACAPHFHSAIEISYVLQGELCAVMNGETVTAQEGQLLISSCYTIHTYQTPVFSKGIITIIPLSTVPSLRQILVEKRFSSLVAPDQDGELLHLMRLLLDNTGNRIITKGLCYTLLGYLIDRVGLTDTVANPKTDLVRHVLTYLDENYSQPLTVKEVAEKFGYSESRFSHLFNAHLNCTLPGYLNVLRCRAAADLLTSSEQSITDIAMSCGFDCMRTFYRAFKASYAVTPRQYAQSHSQW